MDGWIWSGIVFVVGASGFLVWKRWERRERRERSDERECRRLEHVFDEYERERRSGSGVRERGDRGD